VCLNREGEFLFALIIIIRTCVSWRRATVSGITDDLLQLQHIYSFICYFIVQAVQQLEAS